MEAIVLAGGLGVRLRSAVPDLPKPLAPIGGKPFLSYLLNYWVDQGITRFVLSVGYKHEAFQKHFGLKYKNADILYVVENEPLGTGGGLFLAMEQLQTREPFLVLNGDTFFAVDTQDLFSHHSKYGAELTLSLAEVTENNRYSGVLLGENGLIRSLEMRDENANNMLINGGVYLAEHNIFRSHKKNVREKLSLEDDLLPDLLNQKQSVGGFLSKGTFVDIGIPQDYQRATEILLPYSSNL